MSGAGVDRNGKQEMTTIKVRRDIITFLYFGGEREGKNFFPRINCWPFA